MKRNFLFVAAAFALTALAGDDGRNVKISGTLVNIRQTTSVQPLSDVESARFKTIGRMVLARFSVTPSDGSSPTSFIVAGKVVDNNAGAPQERVPILLSSPLHTPRLAALSNVDGEFRFRLWLKEDQRISHLMTPTLNDAILYVDSGRGGPQIYFGNLADDTGLSAISASSYPFRDLLDKSPPTPTPKPKK